MNMHPALRRFHNSLTDSERREYYDRQRFNEDDAETPPPLSPGLLAKFERCCTEILGHSPRLVA